MYWFSEGHHEVKNKGHDTPLHWIFNIRFRNQLNQDLVNFRLGDLTGSKKTCRNQYVRFSPIGYTPKKRTRWTIALAFRCGWVIQYSIPQHPKRIRRRRKEALIPQ